MVSITCELMVNKLLGLSSMDQKLVDDHFQWIVYFYRKILALLNFSSIFQDNKCWCWLSSIVWDTMWFIWLIDNLFQNQNKLDLCESSQIENNLLMSNKRKMELGDAKIPIEIILIISLIIWNYKELQNIVIDFLLIIQMQGVNQDIIGMDIEDDFEFLQQSNDNDPQTNYFNAVVMALQQVVLDQQFEQIQNNFMKEYCTYFDQSDENKMEYMQIFKKYHQVIENYLLKKLSILVQGFQMEKFLNLLTTRTHQIDQQILDMLMSLSDFQSFKQLILDYRLSYQEEERHRIMTIKSNKIPQNKTVKGSNNIFSPNQPLQLQSNDPFNGLKKPIKKNSKKQKTQEEIFVPDLVLTVRPLRKRN